MPGLGALMGGGDGKEPKQPQGKEEKKGGGFGINDALKLLR